MSEAEEKLQAVLEGYSNFLRKRKLALPEHRRHLLPNGIDIREIQNLPGHKSLETMLIYSRVARELKTKTLSLPDEL